MHYLPRQRGGARADAGQDGRFQGGAQAGAALPGRRRRDGVRAARRARGRPVRGHGPLARHRRPARGHRLVGHRRLLLLHVLQLGQGAARLGQRLLRGVRRAPPLDCQ